MNISIVIPTYNEIDNLAHLVSAVFAVQPSVNIVIVDDNSPDGTGQLADTLAHRDPRISVIHRPRKAGLGTAYIEGFQKALSCGADRIIEMDGDLSHDPRYLQDLIDASAEADLVIGSRYLNGFRVDGLRMHRLLLSKCANMYVSHVMVKPVWDFTAGFRCYRRELLEALNLGAIYSDGYAFQIEMTYLAFKYGFSVKEVPIIFRDRKNGSSKISRAVVWEAFWLTLRCRAPLREILRRLSFLFKSYDQFIQSCVPPTRRIDAPGAQRRGEKRARQKMSISPTNHA